MKEFAQDVITKYRKDGSISMISEAPSYIYKHFQLLSQSPFVCVENNAIYNLADEVTSVVDGEKVKINYNGKQGESLPKYFIEAEGQYETPERKICRFSSSKIVGKEPIIKKESKYIPPSGIGTSKYKSQKQVSRHVNIKKDFFKEKLSSKNDKKLKNGFLLTGSRGTHYPHWLWTTLPKLRALENYCRRSNMKIPTIIMPSNLTDWHYKSLRLLGYTSNQVIELPQSNLFVENLFVPSHRVRTYGADEWHLSPSDLIWLRDRIISNVSIESDFGEKIYIARGDSERRRVLNEGKIINTLEKFGFESYEMSELSFEQEVEIFNKAKIVVGPHGAGLSSLLFADDISFIEILTPNRPVPHYFLLAHELGFDYEYLPSELEKSNKQKPVHGDMIVDIDSLIETLSLVE